MESLYHSLFSGRMLSLKEMALRRVIINLWTERDVLVSIVNFRFNTLPGKNFDQCIEYCQQRDELNKELREIVENNVRKKIETQVIPKNVKEQVIRTFKFVGSQLLKWRLWFYESLETDSPKDWTLDTLKKICWTSVATIDYRKTALNLVRIKTIDVLRRFKLACLYCLEDDLKDIWKELPQKYKQWFFDENYVSFMKEEKLEFYWAHVLQAKEMEVNNINVMPSGEVLSIYKYLFQLSAFLYSKESTQYFFQKLTQEERKSVLLETVYPILRHGRKSLYKMFYDFPTVKLSSVLYYLLSVMTPKQLKRVFIKYPGEVLTCFLEWPWEDVFLKIADYIWTILPESKYVYLINKVKVNINNSGRYDLNVIQRFFTRSPPRFQKCLVCYEINSGFKFFKRINRIIDVETIKVFLQSIGAEERERLIFSDYFLARFDPKMRGKCPVVELCCQEATLTKQDRDQLKEACEDILTRGMLTGVEPRELPVKRLLKYLKKMDANEAPPPKKRKADDDQSFKRPKKSGH